MFTMVASREVRARVGSSAASAWSIRSVVATIFTSAASFWLGLQINVNQSVLNTKTNCCPCNKNSWSQDFVDPSLGTAASCSESLANCRRQLQSQRAAINIDQSNSSPVVSNSTTTKEWDSKPRKKLFDKTQIGKLLSGMALTNRANFTNAIDLGVPLDPLTESASHVLLLYGKNGAMSDAVKAKIKADGPFLIPEVNFEDSVANCKTLQVWLLDLTSDDIKKDAGTCWALVPQFGSFHVQKYKRMKPRNLKHTHQSIDETEPFRLSPRSLKPDGWERYMVPQTHHRNIAQAILSEYLVSQPRILKNLQATIDQSLFPLDDNNNKGKKKLGDNNKKLKNVNSTLIVMVCNSGQADVLANFVCSARSRQLDLSRILVFATDKETVSISHSLGLATFYDHKVSV